MEWNSVGHLMRWGRIQRIGLARRVGWPRQGATVAGTFRRRRPGRRPPNVSHRLPVGGIAHTEGNIVRSGDLSRPSLKVSPCLHPKIRLGERIVRAALKRSAGAPTAAGERACAPRPIRVSTLTLSLSHRNGRGNSWRQARPAYAPGPPARVLFNCIVTAEGGTIETTHGQ